MASIHASPTEICHRGGAGYLFVAPAIIVSSMPKPVKGEDRLLSGYGRHASDLSRLGEQPKRRPNPPPRRMTSRRGLTTRPHRCTNR